MNTEELSQGVPQTRGPTVHVVSLASLSTSFLNIHSLHEQIGARIIFKESSNKRCQKAQRQALKVCAPHNAKHLLDLT